MSTPIVGLGTPEQQWQDWHVTTRFPAYTGGTAIDPASADVLVVAPHPDDEVLGVGGFAAQLHAQGANVRFLAVTDGDASHPGSPTLTPAQLVTRRLAERGAALHELGLGDCPVVRLKLPDGQVRRHEAKLADAITDLCGPTTVVLSTWRGDGHPDHEATGRASATAAGRQGSTLLEFPIWMWHWAEPGGERVPWHRMRTIALDPATSAAKRAAADRFVTQTMPLSEHPADSAILPPSTLARLMRSAEFVLTPSPHGLMRGALGTNTGR